MFIFLLGKKKIYRIYLFPYFEYRMKGEGERRERGRRARRGRKTSFTASFPD